MISKCIQYIIKENGKSVVAERFIRIIIVSKNVYIDKLDDMVGEYNNTYHKQLR